jgi:hypothetical protein
VGITVYVVYRLCTLCTILVCTVFLFNNSLFWGSVINQNVNIIKQVSGGHCVQTVYIVYTVFLVNNNLVLGSVITQNVNIIKQVSGVTVYDVLCLRRDGCCGIKQMD